MIENSVMFQPISSYRNARVLRVFLVTGEVVQGMKQLVSLNSLFCMRTRSQFVRYAFRAWVLGILIWIFGIAWFGRGVVFQSVSELTSPTNITLVHKGTKTKITPLQSEATVLTPAESQTQMEQNEVKEKIEDAPSEGRGSESRPSERVVVFYYPWYGNPVKIRLRDSPNLS
jgi:hypothetical protein